MNHFMCRIFNEVEVNCLKIILFENFMQVFFTFQHLDASRPWFCYWGMHSLKLLEASLDENLTSRYILLELLNG